MTRLFQLVAADDGLYIEFDLGDGPQRKPMPFDADDPVWSHAAHEVWRRLRENPPHPRKHKQYEYKQVMPKAHEGRTAVEILNELGAVGWQLMEVIHQDKTHVEMWTVMREKIK